MLSTVMKLVELATKHLMDWRKGLGIWCKHMLGTLSYKYAFVILEKLCCGCICSSLFGCLSHNRLSLSSLSHSGEELAGVMVGLLKSYDILHKVVNIIADNASNDDFLAKFLQEAIHNDIGLRNEDYKLRTEMSANSSPSYQDSLESGLLMTKPKGSGRYGGFRWTAIRFS